MKPYNRDIKAGLARYSLVVQANNNIDIRRTEPGSMTRRLNINTSTATELNKLSDANFIKAVQQQLDNAKRSNDTRYRETHGKS